MHLLMVEGEIAEPLAMHMVEHPECAAAARRGRQQRCREEGPCTRLMLLRPDIEIVAAGAEDGVIIRWPRPMVGR